MKYGLKNGIIEKMMGIFASYHKIEKVLLYGSRAKGNYKTGSDVDLTLKGFDLDIQDLNNLYLKLDNLNLPYGFDILIFEKLDNQDLIDHINRNGIVIYEKQNQH